MLVAPLTLPAASVSASRRRCAAAQQAWPPATRVRSQPPTRWAPIIVGAWLVVGLAGVIGLPAARGSALLGATLPFWLVVAPLLDLAWLRRAAISAALRRRAQSAQARMASARACRPRRHWRR